LCHQKFNDHTKLAQHYTDTHANESVIKSKDTNITQQDEIQVVTNNREDLIEYSIVDES
jgi:hypothetical protein